MDPPKTPKTIFSVQPLKSISVIIRVWLSTKSEANSVSRIGGTASHPVLNLVRMALESFG